MAILRVTVTQDYWIDMFNDKITEINGWTIEEVIEDWFKNNSLGSYHATREGHKIGNGDKFVKSEIVSSKHPDPPPKRYVGP